MQAAFSDIPAAVTPWVERWIATQGLDPGTSRTLTLLKGDGSARKFFRLALDGRSYILLLDPGWVFTKDYAAHQTFLGAKGMPVPRFLTEDPDAGVLIMEDLGDELLQDVIARESAKRTEWLMRATRLLAELHGRTWPTPTDLPAHGRRFDREIYLRELTFTAEHLAKGMLGETIAIGDAAVTRFCETLDGLGPVVFCHRDYHTRNIMVHRGDLWLIDFQDARMGPPVYDVASLVYDAYLPLDDSLRDAMIETYEATLRGYPIGKDIDWPAFRSHLALVGYQRTLKAAGSFASFFTRYGKRSHLPYLAPCLDNVRRLQSSFAPLNSVFPVDRWIEKVRALEGRNWQLS